MRWITYASCSIMAEGRVVQLIRVVSHVVELDECVLVGKVTVESVFDIRQGPHARISVVDRILALAAELGEAELNSGAINAGCIIPASAISVT